MAGNHNIILEQGADFQLNLTLKQSNGLPLNLTNYTGFAQIRLNPDDPVLANFDVSFTNPRSSGNINLKLASAITIGLNFYLGFYDFYIVKDNIKTRILEGNIRVSKTISREI